MNGRKVVGTGFLNLTDVTWLAVLLGLFLALLAPGILREAFAVPSLSRPEPRILRAMQIRGAEGTGSCGGGYGLGIGLVDLDHGLGAGATTYDHGGFPFCETHPPPL